ncbi:HNH endonuclease [Luteitalea sp. TBR-22]|uniref:HNH endonuclease signature motif containing protein n=1 Tax=Luteitalea sp. TBR-22 TaxID=2802971 RepID=UPI001EF4DD45|nr:HNH endonuclease [Luteitalea sp. TBR-22]
MNDKLAYRQRALAHYKDHRCAWCGFARKEVLEVAHLDCDHENCGTDNLVVLCPTCHRMHDIDLLSTEEVRARRERLSSPESPEAVEVTPCGWCGFGIEPGMALSGAASEATPTIILCPSCRERAARGYISEAELAVRFDNRDRPADWKKLSKKAAEKAGRTRSRKSAARKAVRTRLANKARVAES